MTTLQAILFSGFLLMVGAFNTATAGDFPGNQLYVSTSGNDAVSRANNTINNPWRTIGQAMLNTQPGDVVNFRAGTYSVTSTITTNQQTSASNGTANNRIVYTNYQDEVVTFSVNATAAIRIDRQYWTISGINGTTAGKVFWIGQDGNADNFIVEKGTFTLTQQGGAANLAPLVFQTAGSYNAIVRDNRFIGPGANLNPNTAGVFIFRSQNIKVLNNEFSGFPSALFYKHPGVSQPTGIEFAYNYFTNNNIGIRSVSMYADIHDNLLVNSNIMIGQGGGTGDDGSNQGGDFNTIRNNTMVNADLILVSLSLNAGLGATNTLLRDNVFTRRVQVIPFDNINHQTSLDYNLYVPGGAIYNNRINYSLSAWQSFYDQDENSISGAPVFSGGANPGLIFDYALANGSPGSGQSSVGGDMGANVSLVGILGQSGAARPKPPIVTP